MGFQVTESQWLLTHVNIASSIFRLYLDRREVYTPGELQDLLSQHGHTYSNPDWNEIRQELVRRGILGEAD